MIHVMQAGKSCPVGRRPDKPFLQECDRESEWQGVSYAQTLVLHHRSM
jgi:hypothetical protein